MFVFIPQNTNTDDLFDEYYIKGTEEHTRVVSVMNLSKKLFISNALPNDDICARPW